MKTNYKVHPQYGTSCILVDDHPYHWDADLCCYRPGFGAYATTSKIGSWQAATPEQAKEIRGEHGVPTRA